MRGTGRAEGARLRAEGKSGGLAAVVLGCLRPTAARLVVILSGWGEEGEDPAMVLGGAFDVAAIGLVFTFPEFISFSDADPMRAVMK
ncbi:hypothetical protein [Tautonia sociabilis]|uniref:Uncharacterized protein n=1 Tax=Tautonia sociabilis TaxID=2080755 RepID=A0A432MG43_9BACT|nr:hypothetical protein [Tautonia sociabilis]RUL85550.1 hypothetical protein TsocGM_18400 [Tautonia sociabilis]